MGLALGRDGWSKDFKCGLLFLSDFDLEDRIMTPLAVKCYIQTLGFLPEIYSKYLTSLSESRVK